MTREIPDIVLFFGRFHPLIVHLPIGILFLAVAGHFLSRYERFAAFKDVLHVVWLMGAITSFFAALSGFFLSMGGGYDEDTVFFHQTGGVIVVVISWFGFWVFRKPGSLANYVRLRDLLSVLVLVIISITGHLGGNLTHGSNYLFQYAPDPIKKLAGISTASPQRKKVESLDSARIFSDVILPMMQIRCASCHNNEKKKGDLILVTYNDIMQGGESGKIIEKGRPGISELYRRITLPPDHEDFMPTEGKQPLTANQVKLIEWWILNGAPNDSLLAGFEIPQDMEKILENELGLNEMTAPLTPPDKKELDYLRESGFIVNRLSGEGYHYEIKARNVVKLRLDSLLNLNNYLIWLDLSGAKIEDNNLRGLDRLSRLRKLNLSQTAITDDGLEHLIGLNELEVINLYQTLVSDSSYHVIAQLPGLKRVYLDSTKSTDWIFSELQTTRPGLRVFLSH